MKRFFTIALLFVFGMIGVLSAQTTTVYSYDCNSQGGWTLSGTIPNSGTVNQLSGSWSVVTPTTPSPYENACFYTEGNSPYLEAGAGNFLVYVLTSPSINLSGYDNCALSFQSYLDTETGNWDGAYIEYNNGGGWNLLPSSVLCPAYDGNITKNADNPWGGTYTNPAWFQLGSGWELITADISSYDNTSIQFRFILFSDNLTVANGWAIDDIKIVNNPPAVNITNAIQTVSLTNGSSYTGQSYLDFGTTASSKTFIIQNNGTNSTLNLTGTPDVSISGSSNFTVVQQPASSTISGGGTQPFVIQFTPTAPLGYKYATITVQNDDIYSTCPNSSNYTLYLRGEMSNQPPVANNDSWIVYVNDWRSIPGKPTGGVLLNDTDGDSDPLTVGNPGNRTSTLGVTVNLASDGSFTYTAPANQVDVTDSFTYYANDGQANSNTATVSIYLRKAIYNGTAPNGTAGNWNGGYVPNSTTDVVFESGNIEVSTSMVIRNLQIYNAATFYCTGGATLIVNNSIGNEHRTGMMLSSPLIIKSGIKV
ncbi:MAG: hypothetical protein EOL88_11120, partial [Bacteroidia bacterium]|nr:hypothetical protein [Bacteroidia bacterium]